MLASMRDHCWLSIFLCVLFVRPTSAGMVGSIGSDANLRESKLRNLKAITSQEHVAKELRKFGLSSDEVDARLEKLTDDEVDALASRLDRVLAGQQSESDTPRYKRMGFWVLWAVVVVLIIVVFIGIGNNVGEVP